MTELIKINSKVERTDKVVLYSAPIECVSAFQLPIDLELLAFGLRISDARTLEIRKSFSLMEYLFIESIGDSAGVLHRRNLIFDITSVSNELFETMSRSGLIREICVGVIDVNICKLTELYFDFLDKAGPSETITGCLWKAVIGINGRTPVRLKRRLVVSLRPLWSDDGAEVTVDRFNLSGHRRESIYINKTWFDGDMKNMGYCYGLVTSGAEINEIPKLLGGGKYTHQHCVVAI